MGSSLPSPFAFCALFCSILVVVISADSQTSNDEFWEPATHHIDHLLPKSLRETNFSLPREPTEYLLVRSKKSIETHLRACKRKVSRWHPTTPEDVDFSVPTPDGDHLPVKCFEITVFQAKMERKYPNIKSYACHGEAELHGFITTSPHQIEGYFTSPMLRRGGAQPVIKDSIHLTQIGHSSGEFFYCYYSKHDGHDDADLHSGPEFLSPIDDEEVSTLRMKGDNSIGLERRQTNEGPSLLSHGESLKQVIMSFGVTNSWYTNTGNGYGGNSLSSANSAINTFFNFMNLYMNLERGMDWVLYANNDDVVGTTPTSPAYNDGGGASNLLSTASAAQAAVGVGRNVHMRHVMGGTFGGGVAYLNAWCHLSGNAFDGNSVTGIGVSGGSLASPNTRNVVYHEVGHQFNMGHTFSGGQGSCGPNYSSRDAWEVGSGTTIMSYYGLCSGDNIRPPEDVYYHSGSLQRAFISEPTAGAGINGCPSVPTINVNGATPNTLPTIIPGLTPNTFSLPRNQPFYLTGKATDVETNPDQLLYRFEQMDKGAQYSITAAQQADRSLIRSRRSTVAAANRPYRRFIPADPNDNELRDGEILPNIDRDLTFQMIVQDADGGVVSSEELIQIQVTNALQTFTVSTTEVSSGTNTISWSQSNLLSSSPTLTAVLITGDGTEYGLGCGIPSASGSASVCFPPQADNSTGMKLRIMGNEVPFFNQNDVFTASTGPGAACDYENCLEGDYGIIIASIPSNGHVCVARPAEIGLEVLPGAKAVNTPVTFDAYFPENQTGFAGSEFSPDSVPSVPPAAPVELTIDTDSTLEAGAYEIQVVGATTDVAITDPLPLTISLMYNSGPPQTRFSQPSDGLTSYINPITFVWNSTDGGFGTTHVLEVSSSQSFRDDDLLLQVTVSGNMYEYTHNFESGEKYYARVVASNGCASNSTGQTITMCTPEFVETCRDFTADDINTTWNAALDAQSTVQMLIPGLTGQWYPTAVRVIDVLAEHSQPDDMNIDLVGPNGTTLRLLSASDISCVDDTNITLNFEDFGVLIGDGAGGCEVFVDYALNATFISPPSPNTFSDTFYGLDAEEFFGNWTLVVGDSGSGGSGLLKSWTLQVCYINVTKEKSSCGLSSDKEAIDAGLLAGVLVAVCCFTCCLVFCIVLCLMVIMVSGLAIEGTAIAAKANDMGIQHQLSSLGGIDNGGGPTATDSPRPLLDETPRGAFDSPAASPLPQRRSVPKPPPPRNKVETKTTKWAFEAMGELELTVPKGAEVEVIEIDGEWMRVRYNGNEGCIPTNYV